ncbi:coiled-coil domain-containing 42 like-2-like protein [Labeo rohita]|uniref:Coiled-coil domain-containing 42 like-2-like protein n=1 Tax=Labeo rohita TaxID=84645 RepID=A0A498N665_LABRO|nr:coiled-coil domain-containing 42 like-2-like protein [Labeo rohita]
MRAWAELRQRSGNHLVTSSPLARKRSQWRFGPGGRRDDGDGLPAAKGEMQMKREDLKERDENVKKEEEKLKKSIVKYNKFLQENDARRLRAIKKAEAERAQIRLKELEIQKLNAENDTLLAQKELLENRVRKATWYQEFLERAAKMSGKELKLRHFHSTAAKETLLFAQLKATICNIYQMITHYKRVSVDTEDTFKQLEMVNNAKILLIQKYFQIMKAIDDELKFNIMTRPNRTEEKDSRD